MTCVNNCPTATLLAAYMRMQALQTEIAYMTPNATADERIDQLKKLNGAMEEVERAGSRVGGRP